MDLQKIQVQNSIVQLKGDHTANLVFQQVKQKLIDPFVNINTHIVDLSIKNRYFTSDKNLQEAIQLLKQNQVGIKCATHVDDKMYIPCSTLIKRQIKGTTLRRPIIFKDLKYNMIHWKKPITIISHNENDLYKSISKKIKKDCKVQIKIVTEQNEETYDLFNTQNKEGICALFFNEVQSIQNFAKVSMRYALNQKQPLYLSTKNTILKKYDGTYKQIFQNIYDTQFKTDFEKAGIFYQHRLIDDMVAYMMKTEGGYIWACKQYDSENLSSLIAEGFGSQSLMTSMVITDDGLFMSEPVHGTYRQQYKQVLNGQKPTINPIGTIFTWTRGLNQRAVLDKNQSLKNFCSQLEESTLKIIRKNQIVEDMIKMNPNGNRLNTDEFIQNVFEELIKIKSNNPKLQIILKMNPQIKKNNLIHKFTKDNNVHQQVYPYLTRMTMDDS